MVNYRKRRRRDWLFGKAAVCVCLALGTVVAMNLFFGSFGSGGSVSVPPASHADSSGGAFPPSSPNSSRPTISSEKSSAKPAVSSSTVSSVQSAAESGKEPETENEKPESWFDDAAFVGNSRTEGLRDYDGLGDASYFASKGLMVNTVYTERTIRENGKKMTVMQALQKKKFKKVYLMFGVNELGWSTFHIFVDDYGKIVDDIREYQPGVKIYLQAILPVTAKKSDSSQVYTNSKIASYNKAIQKLAKEKKATYLAVNEAVADPTGALPAEATVDGVHLNWEYCGKWCKYLRTHTNS